MHALLCSVKVTFELKVISGVSVCQHLCAIDVEVWFHSVVNCFWREQTSFSLVDVEDEIVSFLGLLPYLGIAVPLQWLSLCFLSQKICIFCICKGSGLRDHNKNEMRGGRRREMEDLTGDSCEKKVFWQVMMNGVRKSKWSGIWSENEESPVRNLNTWRGAVHILLFTLKYMEGCCSVEEIDHRVTGTVLFLTHTYTHKSLGFCLCNGTPLPSRGAFGFSLFLTF